MQETKGVIVCSNVFSVFKVQTWLGIELLR